MPKQSQWEMLTSKGSTSLSRGLKWRSPKNVHISPVLKVTRPARRSEELRPGEFRSFQQLNRIVEPQAIHVRKVQPANHVRIQREVAECRAQSRYNPWRESVIA